MAKNIFSEAVAQRCFMEKVFLETSQNSQENTCAKVSFLISLYFPVNFMQIWVVGTELNQLFIRGF